MPGHFVVGLALFLLASPPSEPAQLSPTPPSPKTPPQSWIPEPRKKEPEPPVTFRSNPQAETAIDGDSVLGPECPVAVGENSGRLNTLIERGGAFRKARKFEDALKTADEAAGLAKTDADRYLVDTLRGAIFETMGDKAKQAESLRALLSRNCFLVPGERDYLKAKLDGLSAGAPQ